MSDRLSSPAASFSSKSWRSFYTVSSDTKLKLNLDLGYFRTECKQNLKEGGGKLASKSSASVQKDFLKMLAFFCHQNW